MTLLQLKNEMQQGKQFEIQTADGWQKITEFLDQGVKQTYLLTFTKTTLICTADHLIETPDGWVEAITLIKGQQINYKGVLTSFVKLEKHKIQPVCDINIAHNNHRFYANGISVHNCINAAQSNRAGFDHFLKNENHLYDLSALSDYNSLERDATIILSVGQTPEDAAASQVRLQCLKSRETAKFLPHSVTIDGATGTYLTSTSEITDEDAIEMLDELDL